MLISDRRIRWFVCFLALPALWLAVGLVTDVNVKLMVPTAVLAALVSAAIAYGSGRGGRAAVGYFVGTGLMMVLAFALFIAVLFTFSCDGTGDCD